MERRSEDGCADRGIRLRRPVSADAMDPGHRRFGGERGAAAKPGRRRPARHVAGRGDAGRRTGRQGACGAIRSSRQQRLSASLARGWATGRGSGPGPAWRLDDPGRRNRSHTPSAPVLHGPHERHRDSEPVGAVHRSGRGAVFGYVALGACAARRPPGGISDAGPGGGHDDAAGRLQGECLGKRTDDDAADGLCLG